MFGSMSSLNVNAPTNLLDNGWDNDDPIATAFSDPFGNSQQTVNKPSDPFGGMRNKPANTFNLNQISNERKNQNDPFF
jgi:hypothetical protein